MEKQSQKGTSLLSGSSKQNKSEKSAQNNEIKLPVPADVPYSPDVSGKNYSFAYSSEATLDQSETGRRLNIQNSPLSSPNPRRTIDSDDADTEDISPDASPIKPRKRINFEEIEAGIDDETEIDESEMLDIPHEINKINKMGHSSS